jgi:hypothetical protein
MKTLKLPRHALFGILALGFMLASGGLAQDKGPATPAAVATATNYSTQVLKANELFNQDNRDSLAPALALVQAAIQSEPKRFEGYALEALIFAKQGHAKKARQALATAQQLVPADKKERLTKVQAYVEAHAGAPPVASSALSPEVQRKLTVLKLITEDADKAKSAQERRTLLNEFMAKSAEVVELAPMQTNIWVMRGAAAVELDYPGAGFEAGRKLRELGLESSEDSRIRKTFAELERKGWLDTNRPFAIDDFIGKWSYVHSGGTQERMIIFPHYGATEIQTDIPIRMDGKSTTLRAFKLIVTDDSLEFGESPDGQLTLVSRVFLAKSQQAQEGVSNAWWNTYEFNYPPGQGRGMHTIRIMTAQGERLVDSQHLWTESYETKCFPERNCVIVTTHMRHPSDGDATGDIETVVVYCLDMTRTNLFGFHRKFVPTMQLIRNDQSASEWRGGDVATEFESWISVSSLDEINNFLIEQTKSFDGKWNSSGRLYFNGFPSYLTKIRPRP